MDPLYADLELVGTSDLASDNTVAVLDGGRPGIRSAEPRVRKGFVFFCPADSSTKVVVTVLSPGDAAPLRASALTIGPIVVSPGGRAEMPIQGDKVVYATRLESGKAAKLTIWEAF